MAIDPAAGCQKRNGYSPGSSTLTLNTLLPDLTLLDRGLQCLQGGYSHVKAYGNFSKNPWGLNMGPISVKKILGGGG